MNQIQYPTWNDVGIPKSFIKLIKDSHNHSLISYLLVNRVFRFPIKPQYMYVCQHCDHRKTNSRVYEEYTICDGCGKTGRLKVMPQLRMGRDMRPSLDDKICGNIIRKMFGNHHDYFGVPAPTNYFSCGWQLDIKNSKNKNKEEDFNFGKSLNSVSQFTSGESIEQNGHVLAICKSAILTPFLWDDKFDWQLLIKKDTNNETSITSLIYAMQKCNTEKLRSNKLPIFALGGNTNNEE